jgi:hypothetical protein
MLFPETPSMHSQHIGAYLDQSDDIESLMPQATRLLQLRRHLATILPEQLARSCVIANYKQGLIVIFAQNGAIAAKLSHFRPKLITHFTERGIQVTAIEIVVQVQNPRLAAPSDHPARLSRSGLASLSGLASALPDSPLKQVVDGLVRRHSRQDRV